jgi:hypothetical protein
MPVFEFFPSRSPEAAAVDAVIEKLTEEVRIRAL